MTQGLPSRHEQSLALCVGVCSTATSVECHETTLPQLARPELERESTGRELARLRLIVDATLRRVVGRSDPEYEDLVQSALEGVWGALSVRAPGERYPSRWVAAITRNIAIDRLRARSRERRMFTRESEEELEVAGMSALEPEHLTYVRRELDRLSVALQKLGTSHAAVIYLHAVLGYELSAIARVLGMSVAAVQSRLVRGRRALTRDLAAAARAPCRSLSK
jgi:RNA polymerase sigma factor (sigma-70 family)